MTVYLDTSSLIKLFVDEPGSEQVRRQLVDATPATSVIAYAEVCAAFARWRREGRLEGKGLRDVRRAFDEYWPTCATANVTEVIARSAGTLAERYGLRGFDSVHVASFAALANRDDIDEVVFSSFDDALNRAADAWRRQARRKKPTVRRGRS